MLTKKKFKKFIVNINKDAVTSKCCLQLNRFNSIIICNKILNFLENVL